jgi:hypothetical protein
MITAMISLERENFERNTEKLSFIFVKMSSFATALQQLYFTLRYK